MDIITRHNIIGDRKNINVIDDNISIKDLIQQIKKTYNYDNDIVKIKLLLNGIELSESKSIAEYGIANESTIDVSEQIDSLDSYSNVSVKDKNFNGKDFTDVDFSSSIFINCIFDNCDLSNANFKNTNLHFIYSSNIIGEPLNLRDDYKIVEINGIRQILSYGKVFKNINISDIDLTGIQLGFSQKASCKAQGLLKRTSKKYNGKYVISAKYKSKKRSKRKLKT